jgi:hypothetical protein
LINLSSVMPIGKSILDFSICGYYHYDYLLGMYENAVLQITGISATKNSISVSSLLSIICLHK